jgi:exopolyphosphatase/guanosine-5'-triphosphate,3'-diphosphate pyrophosphatase
VERGDRAGAVRSEIRAPVTTPRVAAIDIGTNSTRLLVADIHDGRIVAEVERLLEITRLGDGVDANRRLSEESMERVNATMAVYAERAHALGAARPLATATSAVRDAANGSEFLAELERRHGVRARMLSGDEEARMTFRGVTSARPAVPGTLVCDIGGGSTELVLGDADGVRAAVSLELGCVRMSERFLASDPPAAHELEALRQAAAGALTGDLAGAAQVLIGVAGTVTTLATIDLGLAEERPELIDGHELTGAAVNRLLAELAAMPLAERRTVRGLMPARAPTIVAGAAILAEALRACGLDRLTVSERDILHGAALAAADRP